MSTAPQFKDMARPEGLDDLVNKALVARDPETQKALVFQATKLLYEDVTFIPFNAEAKIVAMDKSVHDYNFKEYVSPNTDAFTDTWKNK
jgi:ABC-type transport system substrate-binding protein